MTTTNKSVIIIGAGIAGLSAGVYAQMNGYKSRIYEMHSLPGGLMTAWKRKGYVIDGCIHWLTGSSKQVYPAYYQLWEEIGLIQEREIFNPEMFIQVEGKDGKVLHLYCDIDRLEQHLLELSPDDSRLIRSICNATRAFINYTPSTPSNALEGLLTLIKTIPIAPQLLYWGRMTMQEFSSKFKDPFLRETFANMWFPQMSAVGLLFTLAMLHRRGAGYPIGGSLPMAMAVEKRYRALGGEIRYDTKVKEILTETLPDGKGSRVVGIRLEDGREERADIVVSAADAHATLYNMLGDRFTTPQFRELFQKAEIFPPILYVGLGVKRTFAEIPKCTGGLEIELDEPFTIAGQPVKRLGAQIYNFDPTLAPAGKTVINMMIPTSYSYWKGLYEEDSGHEHYEAEKQAVALQVINKLEQRFPGLSQDVEMADVATPVTFERFTGNWQGSFEGWIPTPQNMIKPINKTLPGLDNFYMAGQWVQPGGGLPSGVMTGREIVQKICKKDGTKFTTSTN